MSRRRLLILLNPTPDKTFLFFYMFQLSGSMYITRKVNTPGGVIRTGYKLAVKVRSIRLVGNSGVVQTQPNPLSNGIGNGVVKVQTSSGQQDNEHFN